jgi:Tol biopolymer transport system component
MVWSAGLLSLFAATFLLRSPERFWRNPLANAHFQTVTDFAGVQAAAISRDGEFVAFLSNRDGPMDIWLSRIGSEQFHNLTHGSARDLVNPSVRALRFSPDGSLVMFWNRTTDAGAGGRIGIWAVPILGGPGRPYLDGAAELDWSRDASLVVYHTADAGDPLYVSSRSEPGRRVGPVLKAAAGRHLHYPLWSPDDEHLYYVEGVPPDETDIWRMGRRDGIRERLTTALRGVSHPALLDRRTLLFIASDPDGPGSALYSMDVERRVPHRLTSSLDRYTSLSASADGRRVVAVRGSTTHSFWRFPIAERSLNRAAAEPVRLTTNAGRFPRLGRNYLLYVCCALDGGESVWKTVDGNSVELWHGLGAEILGPPALSPDGHWIAFSVRQRGKTVLWKMREDGSDPRVITGTFDLRGSPLWAPDGGTLLVSAGEQAGPRLWRVATDGDSAARFTTDYSEDPAWSRDGRIIVYSGAEIGPTFSLHAISPDGKLCALPPLRLPRGSRRLVFLPGAHWLAFLRGDTGHKEVWAMNLDTGIERQLTNLGSDFDLRDFDVSPDGRELILERAQERSELELIRLPRP